MSEFRPVMPFPKTQPRLNENHHPFKQGRLSREAGSEVGQPKRIGYAQLCQTSLAFGATCVLDGRVASA
ncbi:MAG: hypothetical protein IK053_06175 [Muribaculaceae bacterium]|nr:hypothetical protein [Muribaculaceae bacterium]